MTSTTEPAPSSTPTGEIIARPDSWFRTKWIVMFLVLLGYGIYSIVDGFYRYPKQNAEAKAQGHEILPHPGFDIPFNRFFGVLLPPLAIVLLIRFLRKTRGEIRLANQTVHVPGHPPIPFENITEIDRRLWDKKGIAYIHYDLGEGRSGRALLDDFLYEQAPIDAIYKRVEAFVAPEEEQEKDESKSDAPEAEIRNPNLEIRNKSE